MEWLYLQDRVFSVETDKEYFINELIIPELPIQKKSYFCGKYFKLDELEKCMQQIEEILVIFVFGEETIYYNVKGTNYNFIRKFTLHRQKAQKKGGKKR